MPIDIRVLDNLKDYAVRAVVNAVDHLGTVAYKLTDLFEQQASEISTFELKVARLNQVPLSIDKARRICRRKYTAYLTLLY